MNWPMSGVVICSGASLPPSFEPSFFFHPLAWLSKRQLKLTQEIAADELAIAQQRHDPVSYGELLVSVVGKFGPARCFPGCPWRRWDRWKL